MRLKDLALALALGLAVAGGAACSGGGGDDGYGPDDDSSADDGPGPDGGRPVGSIGKWTGTLCPLEGTELTYQNFGHAFLEDYCLRCHSEHVLGDAREGAPIDHNFDTLAECKLAANHMDQRAGSGPNATNELMPPGDPSPTQEEREQMSLWLACGAR
ncbi:MAG TPA: hypothetical protein VK698_13060 [Kofleriaceae bacterium]|nr:hypothetical protein [Kofleriaceae bacterium]